MFEIGLLHGNRVGDVFDLAATDEIDGQQAEQHHCQDNDIQSFGIRLYRVQGSYEDHHPSHRMDTAISHHGFHTVDLRHTGAAVCLHFMAHFLFEILRDAIFVRMHDDSASPVDDEEVGMVTLSLLIIFDHLIDVSHDAIAEFFQGKISANHRHWRSMAVVDRDAVGGQQTLFLTGGKYFTLVVWFCPAAFVLLHLLLYPDI